MITIKKGEVEVKFPSGSFTVAQDTPTGMYFKFTDGSEFMINADSNPQHKTIGPMLMKSTSDNILVDFNSHTNLISFGK
jgi:hypothetical protein